MFIDTHCHLTAEDLAADIDGIIQRATDAGVDRLVNIATTVTDVRDAFSLLQRFPNVYFSQGIVPHEAACPPEALEQFAAMMKGDEIAASLRSRIVAIGEIGLDFHYDFAPRDRQEKVFRFQLELAQELSLPIVIHARAAEAKVCDILQEYGAFSENVVFHCYSGDLETAERIIENGHFISLTGMVTFRNAGEIREVARMIPDDRLMIETDAPYLSPVPVRNQRPCEPAMVVHTAKFLAELRGMSIEEFADVTTQNAERFFKLPKQSKP